MSKELDHCPHCGADLTDADIHSDKARARYFAILNDVYESLPDHWRTLCPSREGFRKYLLCRVGYCDTRVITAESKTKALELRDAMQWADRFAVVDVRDNVVTVHKARSQRKHVQKKASFLETADKVYAELATMGFDVS